MVVEGEHKETRVLQHSTALRKDRSQSRREALMIPTQMSPITPHVQRTGQWCGRPLFGSVSRKTQTSQPHVVEVRQLGVRKIVIVRRVCQDQIDTPTANPVESLSRLIKNNGVARDLVPLCGNRTAHCWPNPIPREHLLRTVAGSRVPILKGKAAVALTPQDFL